MDINSLLSPSETPQSAPLTPGIPATGSAHSPHKQVRRTQSVPFKQSNAASPLSQSTLPPSSIPPSIPPHVLSPKPERIMSSPLASPRFTALSTTPPASGPNFARSSSTPSMDTLADLASMQNHQPTRSTPPILRNRDSFESQLSPSTIFPAVPAVAVTSNPRSSFDISMVDTNRQSIRVDFEGTSLPLELQQQAGLHSSRLQDHPSTFASHVEIIKILHQGFVDHVYPPSSPNAHGNPYSYDLLNDLRIARENMDKLFAIGEDLWIGWIQDEITLARTIEERVAVIVKCRKAVEEERGSSKLWMMYGEWVLDCYNLVHGANEKPGAKDLSEEERKLAQQSFSWQMVLETWRRAAEHTRWHLDDSHEVWNRYIELEMQGLRPTVSDDSVLIVKDLFEQRLRTPHAQWESTFQIYSGFVSTYLPNQYESLMAAANVSSLDTKRKYAVREQFETALQNARSSGDKDAEYAAFAEYVQLEQSTENRRRPDFELTNAIYERAELRFPSDFKLWEDHVMFIIEKAQQFGSKVSPIPVLDRATRHCPWSGSLWSQYLLASEREGQDFTTTETIKHKATNTGLLDAGGMEEVLKVHSAWCSYLRRRAFRADANDEDLDVAEVGIRSSIENVQDLAIKLGSGPDPLFRLDRIYINFLSDSGSWDSARETFKGLVSKYGDSWEFWSQFYVWEMMCWRKFMHDEHQTGNGQLGKTSSPHYATAVLREALSRPSLDWPEKLMQMLVAHCEDYEDVEELQVAVIEVKKMEKTVTARRQKESQLAAEISAPPAQQQSGDEANRTEAVANGLHTGKRKREDDTQTNGESNKKSKSDKLAEEPVEDGATPEQQVKRDREHATILVQNLPDSITDLRVRQFFRNCGTINSVKILRNDKTSAVIEFEEKEAAEFAQSRDGKELDGCNIAVQLERKATLYVANYPPTADEAYIRELFGKYGEIVDVRFPSLQGNTRRRFCYVQFKFSDQAHSATEMDGLEDEAGRKLIAKISDPSKKQDRSGPTEEGREVFVKNVHFKAEEREIRSVFAEYGEVVSVRVPRKPNGDGRGIAYVVFASPFEANAALAADGQELLHRPLHVEIASSNISKRQTTTILATVSQSKSPEAEVNGEAGSPSAMSYSWTGDGVRAIGSRQERTLALINVPDTVNDSRIRALAEKYGTLVKISLRPAHQGAILEYSETAGAGKASLGLDGYEIAPGKALRVVTVAEMLREKAEVKHNKIQIGQARKESQAAASLQHSAMIRRPGPAAGGRPGGGLGQKKLIRTRKPTVEGEFGNDDDSAARGGKSNDDFRAMLNRG